MLERTDTPPSSANTPWDQAGDDWPRGMFTLPATQPFLPTLAHGLLQRCRDNPLDLARITILLPTRRACRVLRQAFLDAAAAQPPGAESDARDEAEGDDGGEKQGLVGDRVDGRAEA